MPEKLRVVVNDRAFAVEVLEREPHRVRFAVNGRSYQVRLEREVLEAASGAPETTSSKRAPKRTSPPSATATSSGSTAVFAPIPGLVAALLVEVGEQVEAGQSVLRLEAMKMQNSISAPIAGQVLAVHVAVAEEVADGALLLEIAPRAGDDEKP